MADVRCDSRDLTLLLDALNGLLEDFETDLMGVEREAYERLCKLVGVDVVEAYEDEADMGLPRKGIMERTRNLLNPQSSFYDLRGPYRPPGQSKPKPKPDPAKQIADKMARASADAARGTTPSPAPAPDAPKRALTDEEKAALRAALGEDN